MAKKMRRFRLTGGPHFVPRTLKDPDTGGETMEFGRHAADDPETSVVESDKDLMKLFANKFEPVLEPAKNDVSEGRREAVGKVIESGAWDEKDRDFLEQLEDDRFGKISRAAGVDPAAPPPAEKGKEQPLGQEVTRDFKDLPPEYKVWKNAAGKHQVTRGADVAKPLNREPLDAKAVPKFAADHAKESKGK